MNTKVADFIAPLATTGITRRLAIRALPLAVAVALTFGAVAGPESAAAVPVGGAGEAGCYYKGVKYPHGDIVSFDNGNDYKCNNGEWNFVDRSHRPKNSPATTVNPGRVIPIVPGRIITADPGQ